MPLFVCKQTQSARNSKGNINALRKYNALTGAYSLLVGVERGRRTRSAALPERFQRYDVKRAILNSTFDRVPVISAQRYPHTGASETLPLPDERLCALKVIVCYPAIHSSEDCRLTMDRNIC